MIKYSTFQWAVILIFSSNITTIGCDTQLQRMYFVTVSDSEHFPWLEGLINSILQYNCTKVAQIAVFDLGLAPSEIEKLTKAPYIKIYPIVNVNPELRKKFIVRNNGRLARGWYSWKPVVLYQAVKIFPFFLYLDAGVEVIAPLDDVFDEITQKGYYLIDLGSPVYLSLTNHVKQLFNLNSSENLWILQGSSLISGIQGISRSLFEPYIEPMCQLATNIKNFEDDGSTPLGFGFARHDQSLFSIFAIQLHLTTHPLDQNPYFKLKKQSETDPARIAYAQKYNLLSTY